MKNRSLALCRFLFSIMILSNSVYSFGAEKTEFQGDHAFSLAFILAELGIENFNIIDRTPVVAEDIFCLSEEKPKPEVGFYPTAHCFLNIKSNGGIKKVKLSGANEAKIIYHYLSSFDKKLEPSHQLERCLPSGICTVEVKRVKCFTKVQPDLPTHWQNMSYNFCEVIP